MKVTFGTKRGRYQTFNSVQFHRGGQSDSFSDSGVRWGPIFTKVSTIISRKIIDVSSLTSFNHCEGLRLAYYTMSFVEKSGSASVSTATTAGVGGGKCTNMPLNFSYLIKGHRIWLSWPFNTCKLALSSCSIFFAPNMCIVKKKKITWINIIYQTRKKWMLSSS